MAIRPFFTIGDGKESFFHMEECEFTYFKGLAPIQKTKSAESLRFAILKKYPNLKVLEVSTKSYLPLGKALSAFNLRWKTKKFDYPVESIYQGSKVFSNGGPYKQLYNMSPKEAKTYPPLRTSGNIIKFHFQDEDWDIDPPSLFYDFIYIKSLMTNPALHNELMQYDTFTDIEFGKKSFNCQARAVAIFVTLKKYNLIEDFLNKTKFSTIYKHDPSLLI